VKSTESRSKDDFRALTFSKDAQVRLTIHRCAVAGAVATAVGTARVVAGKKHLVGAPIRWVTQVAPDFWRALLSAAFQASRIRGRRPPRDKTVDAPWNNSEQRDECGR